MKRKPSICFHAVVSCDTWQIGCIDNRIDTTSPARDAILQTAFGFWNSKVLFTAVMSIY
jgi:hypothetical protein